MALSHLWYILSATGGLARQATTFYKRLANLLASKHNELVEMQTDALTLAISNQMHQRFKVNWRETHSFSSDRPCVYRSSPTLGVSESQGTLLHSNYYFIA